MSLLEVSLNIVMGVRHAHFQFHTLCVLVSYFSDFSSNVITRVPFDYFSKYKNLTSL